MIVIVYKMVGDKAVDSPMVYGPFASRELALQWEQYQRAMGYTGRYYHTIVHEPKAEDMQ